MIQNGAGSETCTSPSEARLVDRAARGDVAAFEHLYRTHCPRVHAVCLRILGDVQAAEDAVQESFVRAWQKLDGFRQDAALATWLHRIAVNVALEMLRVRSRRRLDTMLELSQVDEPAGVRDTGTMLDLERLITGLPDGARLVYVLHDIEGYRHDEIARLTGTAVGTCKAQLHRARRLLREGLQHDM